VVIDASSIKVELKSGAANLEFQPMLGTTVILLKNTLHGVDKGFEEKLELVGVGYRAKASGKVLDLTLGYSHPVQYNAPAGITIETPSNTEILIKGSEKDVVAQAAADIRAYREPERYKGKGVKYAGEVIDIKETKKK
jgi:large subunit ribosomal protein L6